MSLPLRRQRQMSIKDRKHRLPRSLIWHPPLPTIPPRFAKTSKIDQFLRPLEEGLTDLAHGTTNAEGAAKLRNGNPAVCYIKAEYGDEIWVSYDGKAQAVGRFKSGEIHPARVFLQTSEQYD